MISKQIESLFRQEYGDGMKQAEMAIKYHSDQQTISRLLSGQRKFGGLTLDTVDRFDSHHLHQLKQKLPFRMQILRG